MTTNETMLALHKLVGGVEWEAAGGTIWTLWRGILSWERYSEWASMGITGHEAHALIEKAAIEWLIKQVEYFCIEHDTGQSWEVQWMMAGKDDTRVATGRTLLEALHAAVRAVKEIKDAN